MVKAAQAGDHQRVAELRQQLQDIALQGIAQQSGMLPPSAPIETRPPPSGCPQNILDWTAEMEANGASQNQFSGLTQLANLFRPESFVPHFGKPFGEFSKQEAFKVARDMQLYCLKPNSPLYTSPIATSIGNAFSEHGAFARFDAASAALALETLAAWQTEISDRIDKSSTLQIADAFEIQRANLAKNLWPVENESGREFIAQSISRKASESILQTTEQISLRIQRRDTSSLNELRALTSSELFSKLTPEQSTSTRQSLWLKIDPALDTYFASQLSELRKQDASALLQNGKRWYQSVAQALRAISKRPPYTTFIKQFAENREKAFSELKEELIARLNKVEERSIASNFGYAYAIDIDASFSPTWRELKQARLARVDEIDEKAFLARLGDGPFGPKYPGAVYLNALYRGDLARLKSEDKRLQDPLIAYMRPLLDSGIMDAFGLLASGGILQGNQLSKQMLESARQQNILDPLLAYFVVHYRSAYPNCRDARPATIKRTRTWEDVTRWSDGSETRSPGGSSVDFIEVNQRHKAAWLSFEGDASSPESLEFFNWFGRALSPNGSDYDVSVLSQALRGLKQAMGEYPCDHDVIKTLESNTLAIYEGRQPERAQYVRTSWKGDQTPDSEMNLYVSVLNALSYLDPPRNQVEANKLAKARLDPAPLFEALQSHPAKSLEELRPLLAEYLPNIDLESKNEEGLTPLLVAVFHRCDTEVVQKLIEAGADLQAADPQGNGPIHLAVVTSSATGTPTLERLIAAGADPNKANNRGYTPAHQSVGFSSDPSVIRVLAAAGADYNRPNPRGESPLYTALKFKAAEPILQALLDAGADPIVRDSNGAILANVLEAMPSLKPAPKYGVTAL
ncbi:MAG: ankyrin repeat domain-containing protein [Verrucomicrobiota bacterium]